MAVVKARLRDKVRQRDGLHCHYCGVLTVVRVPRQGSNVPRGHQKADTSTIDHRLPRAAGGPDVLANLVVACLSCNREKGDMTEEQFMLQRAIEKARTMSAAWDRAAAAALARNDAAFHVAMSEFKARKEAA